VTEKERVEYFRSFDQQPPKLLEIKAIIDGFGADTSALTRSMDMFSQKMGFMTIRVSPLNMLTRPLRACQALLGLVIGPCSGHGYVVHAE
jgi:hypothetical protein